eukprot:scaffold107436_cov45-Prasinocladus_malaysianus.AAC.3
MAPNQDPVGFGPLIFGLLFSAGGDGGSLRAHDARLRRADEGHQPAARAHRGPVPPDRRVAWEGSGVEPSRLPPQHPCNCTVFYATLRNAAKSLRTG